MHTESYFPNEEQRIIVEAIVGPQLVLAPAGCGKTRVMAERLALALEGGMDPDRALCVTFTNRAASEMRQRIRELLPEHCKRIHVKTFHGLCAWILRQEASNVGLPSDFAVYDEDDAIQLLSRILRHPDRINYSFTGRDFFWEMSQRKSHAKGNELTLNRIPSLFLHDDEYEERECSNSYHNYLSEWHAFDFADLIYRVRAILTHHTSASADWANRFDWVQVDETQDTHTSEYNVLSHLAKRTGNLALFGDVDQTIYEWRGSKPSEVFELFERDFGEIECHSLTLNYRATKKLIQTADQFANSFDKRSTQLTPHPSLDEGEGMIVQRLNTADEEATFIARSIADLQKSNPKMRIGVLARTHQRTRIVSRGMESNGIEHVTVEQFEFFRRQEVKDAMARLRIIVNPYDSWSVQRILERPKSGIGAATLKKIGQEAFPLGLRLVDLLKDTTHIDGEPFARLIQAFHRSDVVVFDVETTGLNVNDDEVIEIAACRVGVHGVEAKFHRFLVPVGHVNKSQSIHGHSDNFLAEHGEDACKILTEFKEFVGGVVVVGHNVRFDMAIVRSHASRLGVNIEFKEFEDTLDLSRRFFKHLNRFDLDSLAKNLDLEIKPTHRAMDDVGATIGLLEQLVFELDKDSLNRCRVVEKYGSKFRQIAANVESWKRLAEQKRPGDLLRTILKESGLGNHYSRDSCRTANLNRLVHFLNSCDRPELSPNAALEEMITTAALVKNIDFMDDSDRRVPVITVHQSKGLEFEAVFIAGLNEDEFPSFFSVRDGNVEEERRLFYVALTRAQRRLILTSFCSDAEGASTIPSQFLEVLNNSFGK